MTSRVHAERASRRAFSLFEILIVIAIIGLLAALAVPRLVKQLGKAQVQTTKANIALLNGAVVSFRTDVGRYPSEQEGLAALVSNDASIEQWDGPYLERVTLPQDGWNRDFVYKLDEQFGYRIVSYGADGQPGGDGENADLDNRT
ncbi:MAG: type II secretion system major pseudopilin GspG [Planctomycetota bacterium]